MIPFVPRIKNFLNRMSSSQAFNPERRRFLQLSIAAGIAGFLGPSCTLSQSQAVRLPLPENTQAPSPPEISPFEHAIKSALNQIFSNSPKVVAFGEIHKTDLLNYPSTALRFAEIILPHLPEYGIKDLVIEFLPDDPVIDAELALFREKGRISNETPNIRSWMDGPEYCGIRKILEVARVQNITLHGGNLSLAEVPNVSLLGDMVAQDLEGIANRVGKHTLQRIQRILDQGRPVASYGGMRHNNINPSAADVQASYGDELVTQLGDKYVEVDLLVPEPVASYVEQIHLENWEMYIPSEGFNLINQGQRFLLIFPRTPNVHEVPIYVIQECP